MIVPAAGMGTRFLPATKAVPKELMPLGDAPALQYVIDEALGAGIDHIVLVSSAAKPAIAEYAKPAPELVEVARRRGDDALAERLAGIGRDWYATVVLQDAPRGLGHAVGCARDVVEGDAVAVALPDEVMGDSSLLSRMVDICGSTGGSVVGVMSVPMDETHAYGVVRPAGPVVDDVVPVADLVEKPAPGTAPSNHILIGRYVLTMDVFDEIAATQPGAGGEIQLTDALRAQAARGPFHAVLNRGERWDTGTPLGFLLAAIDIASRDPHVAAAVREHLAQG